MSFLRPNFREMVDTLRNVSSRCDDLTRISQPYIAAANWERETGKSIAEVVGTAAVTDMYVAVEGLIGHGQKCTSCGAAACTFAGVEKPTLEETLTLIEG